MPEGHTIHRLARDQATDLAGHAVDASAAQSRFAEGAAVIDGSVLERSDAWGKHLFHTFDSGLVLHVHLGLIGKWFRRTGTPLPDPTPTTRLRLARDGYSPPSSNGSTDSTGAKDQVAWDLTGPMTCAVITPDERKAVVATLGPDPLRRDADPERMWARLQRSTKPIGLLLMEQDVVAGIGNVYRSELLNIVGVDPRRPGKQLARDEFDHLWAETVRQLRLGVRRNKIVTMSSDELTKPVSRMVKGEGLYAYKQERCGRCQTELDVFPLAGRTTWRCPTCQPA